MILLLSAAQAFPAAGATFPPVSDEERALQELPAHPGAPAVYLFKKAELRLMDRRQDISSIFKAHARLKILTEEGKEYGEVEIQHSRFFRLSAFEGRTVLPDGRVVDLPDDSIFKERSSRARKSFVTKAAFPAVEVGAIIEYRYSMRWDSLYFIEPWYFHDRVPVLLSEIVYQKPDNMGIRRWGRQSGRQQMQMDATKTTRGVDFRVWMEDLPAVPDEPFSFPFEDLSAHFMLIPEELMLGGTKLSYFDSWNHVCADLEEMSYGKSRNKARQAKKKASELAAGSQSLREQAAAVYGFVRDEIVTTSSDGVFVFLDKGVDQVLDDRQGSASDKALLLQAMLGALKLKPQLVWVADRREGTVDLNLPNPWWFDRIVVAVEIDAGRVYLDPADRRLGFGQLSPYHEGTQALLFHKKKPEVITLPHKAFDENVRRAVLDLDLDEDGRVTGRGSLDLGGHHAWRRLRWKDGAEATAEAWQEWLAGVFTGYEASGVEVEESLDSQKIHVTWELAQRQEEVLGDETSLEPCAPLGPVRQPFALPPERRMTPVRFAFGDRDEVEMSLSWPAGWELDLVPDAVSFSGEVGLLTAAVEIDEANRRLVYKRRVDVHHRDLVGREKYAALRGLYGEVEKSDVQELVLVRH